MRERDLPNAPQKRLAPPAKPPLKRLRRDLRQFATGYGMVLTGSGMFRAGYGPVSQFLSRKVAGLSVDGCPAPGSVGGVAPYGVQNESTSIIIRQQLGPNVASKPRTF